MTFADILDRTALRYPHKTALICEEGKFTYSQLQRRVNSLAQSFAELGIGRGDRVAVLAHDCHWYVEMYLAAARLGFTLVPLNYRLVGRELLFILQDCVPVAMLVEDSFASTIDALRPNLGSVRHYVGLGRVTDADLHYEDLASKSAPTMATVARDDDVLCILYTSGTTGFPKGAMLTNRNQVANNMNVMPFFQFKTDDINLVTTPLFHTAALWPTLGMVYVGGRSVIRKTFDVKTTLRLFEQENVTFCHPVQAQVIMMLEDPDITSYDFSTLRCMNITLNLPLPAYRKAVRCFGNVIVPGYGLTEAAPMATALTPEEARRWAEVLEKEPDQVPTYGCSGRALPGVQVRAVDEAGDDVAPGQVGELLVKGDNVMKGYWNRPEVNAVVLRDGWLHTGDLVRFDAQGYMYFVDRKSGMIKTGGENVYPKEVEDVISTHPGVLAVAVFGVPHEKWGETVAAAIVRRPGATIDTDDVIDVCRRNLAGYKKPTLIEFVDELPRSLSGKVAKNVLRQMYSERG